VTRRTTTSHSEQARLDAEAQHRQIEASRGGREPDATLQVVGTAPAARFSGRCRDHPSQMVDGRTGKCRLCPLLEHTMRELQRDLRENEAAPPGKPRLV
jgi:hypothetical protein